MSVHTCSGVPSATCGGCAADSGRVIVTWKRPGLAKALHAYEQGASLSLCRSWVGSQAESQIAKPAQSEACRECWHKAQAKKYRR